MTTRGTLSSQKRTSEACRSNPPAGSVQFDWIGLHRVSDSNNVILWWIHTGGAATGQAQVQMPREEGDYEFRYFINNSLIDKRATSNTVTVTVPHSLTASPARVCRATP